MITHIHIEKHPLACVGTGSKDTNSGEGKVICLVV